MDLDTLKRRLQAHLSDGLVTIIGSGLSCAEGLPGLRQLADHLLAKVGPGLNASDLALWGEIGPVIRAKGLEAALLERAPSQALEAAIGSETAKLVGEHERSVISEVFAGRRTLRLTSLVKHLVKPATGLPIVTPNYDRLGEVAVEEAGLGVDTMFVGRFAARLDERESQFSFCRDARIKNGRAKLQYCARAMFAKPHGSLDWYLRDGRPVQYGGDLPGVPRLIITPGRNKFRNGYESPFVCGHERH